MQDDERIEEFTEFNTRSVLAAMKRAWPFCLLLAWGVARASYSPIEQVIQLHAHQSGKSTQELRTLYNKLIRTVFLSDLVESHRQGELSSVKNMSFQLSIERLAAAKDIQADYVWQSFYQSFAPLREYFQYSKINSQTLRAYFLELFSEDKQAPYFIQQLSSLEVQDQSLFLHAFGKSVSAMMEASVPHRDFGPKGFFDKKEVLLAVESVLEFDAYVLRAGIKLIAENIQATIRQFYRNEPLGEISKKITRYLNRLSSVEIRDLTASRDRFYPLMQIVSEESAKQSSLATQLALIDRLLDTSRIEATAEGESTAVLALDQIYPGVSFSETLLEEVQRMWNLEKQTLIQHVRAVSSNKKFFSEAPSSELSTKYYNQLRTLSSIQIKGARHLSYKVNVYRDKLASGSDQLALKQWLASEFGELYGPQAAENFTRFLDLSGIDATESGSLIEGIGELIAAVHNEVPLSESHLQSIPNSVWQFVYMTGGAKLRHSMRESQGVATRTSEAGLEHLGVQVDAFDFVDPNKQGGKAPLGTELLDRHLRDYVLRRSFAVMPVPEWLQQQSKSFLARGGKRGGTIRELFLELTRARELDLEAQKALAKELAQLFIDSSLEVREATGRPEGIKPTHFNELKDLQNSLRTSNPGCNELF